MGMSIGSIQGMGNAKGKGLGMIPVFMYPTWVIHGFFPGFPRIPYYTIRAVHNYISIA